jgi:hypothetical protein
MKRRRSSLSEIQARISETRKMAEDLFGDLPPEIVLEAVSGVLQDILEPTPSGIAAETSAPRDAVSASRKARLQ